MPCSATGWLARADTAAGVLGGGLARADMGAAARWPCCAARATAAARPLADAGRGGGFIRLCHATDQGAVVPRQDR